MTSPAEQALFYRVFQASAGKRGASKVRVTRATAPSSLVHISRSTLPFDMTENEKINILKMCARAK